MVRPGHPLDGQSLAILSHRRRNGRPHLVLAPPNADPILIPVEWTDLAGGSLTEDTGVGGAVVPVPPTSLGSIIDLIHLRAVADGLLRRPPPADGGNRHASPLEGTGATLPEPSAATAASRQSSPPARPAGARRSRPGAGADHGQDHAAHRGRQHGTEATTIPGDAE